MLTVVSEYIEGCNNTVDPSGTQWESLFSQPGDVFMDSNSQSSVKIQFENIIPLPKFFDDDNHER